MQLDFCRYYKHAELTSILRKLEKAHPRLMKLRSIGASGSLGLTSVPGWIEWRRLMCLRDLHLAIDRPGLGRYNVGHPRKHERRRR